MFDLIRVAYVLGFFMIFRFPKLIKIPPPNNSLKRSEKPIVLDPPYIKQTKKMVPPVWCMARSKFWELLDFPNVEIWKIICVKDVSIFFLYVLKHSCDKYGVSRSTFGEHFGSSKNDRKTIGIRPGTLISHLGIIQNPKNTIKYYSKYKTNPKHHL